MSELRKARPATEVAHLGRDPHKHLGAINTPVYRASTILFERVADLEAAERGEYPGISYGLHGLPTVTDLQSAVATLEGGYAALAVPSGIQKWPPKSTPSLAGDAASEPIILSALVATNGWPLECTPPQMRP